MAEIKKIGQLLGHEGEVLGVAVDADDKMVLSGGDDGVRLWSSKGETISSLPISSINSNKKTPSTVQSVCFGVDNPNDLIFAAEQGLYNYDIRNLSKCLWSNPSHAMDDINQVALSEKGRYLASADDSGDVLVLDLHSKALHARFTKAHSNICSTVAFRPRKPGDFVSGGFDYKMSLWSYTTKKCLHSQESSILKTADKEEHDGSLTMVNPPFIHSLSCSPDGKHVLASLGSGNVVIYDFVDTKGKDSKLLPRYLFRGGHTCAASHVTFATFDPTSLTFISGGDDRHLTCWRLTPQTTASLSKKDTKRGHAPLDEDDHEGKGARFIRHEHGSKVNSIFSSSKSPTFYCSDQTNNISLYQVL